MAPRPICAICGRPVGGARNRHPSHTARQLAPIRTAIDEAARPLTLLALMYLLDPAGVRAVVGRG